MKVNDKIVFACGNNKIKAKIVRVISQGVENQYEVKTRTDKHYIINESEIVLKDNELLGMRITSITMVLLLVGIVALLVYAIVR